MVKHARSAAVLAGAALLVGACATSNPAQPVNDLVYKASPYSVTETLNRLEAVATARGARVFARVDHAAGATSVGTQLPDSQLLIFGNPAVGTPVLLEAPTAGVDLPLRVLAMDKDGTTYLVYTSHTALARRHGVAADNAAIVRVGGALDALTSAAVAADDGS